MALENLVDGMTGLQMANTIKNNFDKVLDAESAENKAENAGLSIKTDYDATRYIDLQLADGTPVKMKMDVFCQAIAPVVAGLFSFAKFIKKDNATGDANAVLDNVIYLNNAKMENVPIELSKYGTLIAFAASTAHVVQFYILATNVNKMYMRQRTGGTWTSWSTIL